MNYMTSVVHAAYLLVMDRRRGFHGKLYERTLIKQGTAILLCRSVLRSEMDGCAGLSPVGCHSVRWYRTERRKRTRLGPGQGTPILVRV